MNNLEQEYLPENTIAESRSSFFWSPNYLEPSAWIEHIPFAFWLVENLQPATIVELGVYNGTSFFSFCQAVERLDLNTSCYGVDTWQGDEHAGFYNDEVYNRVKNYNDNHYSRFATLIRSSFDEARPYFVDRSVSLLHIDGLHTYEAVKHDFETWLPTLADNAIVVFHDINVRERGFGVFKFWEELKKEYDHFEFDFGSGLGVLATGTNYNHMLNSLFQKNRSSELYPFLKNLFSERGSFFKKKLDFAFLKNESDALKAINASLQSANDALKRNSEQLRTDLEHLNTRLQTETGAKTEMLYEKQRLQDQMEALRQQHAKDEAQHAFFKSLLADYKKETEEIRRKLERARSKNEELADTYEQNLQNLQAQADAAVQHQEAMAAQYNDLLHQYNHLRQQHQALLHETGELKNIVENLNKDLLLASKQDTGQAKTSLIQKMSAPVDQRFPHLAAFSKRTLRAIHWTLKGTRKQNSYKLKFWKTHPHVPFELIDDYLAIEQSGFFDREWYFKTYPDVKNDNADPVLHYLLHGYFEGRDPGPSFSTLRYINYHRDVKEGRMNPLLHYVRHGIREDRRTFPAGTEQSGAGYMPPPGSPLAPAPPMAVPKQAPEKAVPASRNDFLKRPVKSRSKRNITRISKVAFIAQPEYFDFHYRDVLEDEYNVKYFQNSFSEDPQFFRELVDFDADINIFFRGELVPAGVLNALSGIRVNMSSEPFPKILNRSIIYTADSLERFQFFLRIFDRPYDYIFHYDEVSKEFFENQGIQLSGFFPFPIATELIKPDDNAIKKWDMFFSGRSTPHRDVFFGPLKRDFNFLHINHGVVGPDLLEFIQKCKISLNVHAENEISWEPRTQFLMAAGSLLVSEPLSPTCPLRPGIDFIEVRDGWNMYETCQKIIANYADYKHIAENGRKRIVEVLSSSRIFPAFFQDILDGKYEAASFNKSKLALEPLQINLKYNGFEHLLTELLHEHA